MGLPDSAVTSRPVRVERVRSSGSQPSAAAVGSSIAPVMSNPLADWNLRIVASGGLAELLPVALGLGDRVARPLEEQLEVGDVFALRTEGRIVGCHVAPPYSCMTLSPVSGGSSTGSRSVGRQAVADDCADRRRAEQIPRAVSARIRVRDTEEGQDEETNKQFMRPPMAPTTTDPIRRSRSASASLLEVALGELLGRELGPENTV